jgi:hypothetical protein
VAEAPISLPWRVVHMLSEAPIASTTSELEIRSAASSDAKPPEIPIDQSPPANSPFPLALVASTAPTRSAIRSSAGPAWASTAPRPAMMTGRLALASASAAAWMERAAGSTGESVGGGTTGTASAVPASTPSGRFSSTGLRSIRARCTARAESAIAVSGLWTRSASAPTDTASAAWSMRKFERAPSLSAARSSSGVRLFAASVRPVAVFVRPGPWCTEHAGSSPLIRA